MILGILYNMILGIFGYRTAGSEQLRVQEPK
jgi:hypothetical protein